MSQYRIERPAVIASLLDIWDCDSKITQKSWAESAQEKKRLRDLIQDLHRRFRAEVVMPYLAQWRQYVYRLSVTLLTRAREHARAERRRINSLNYGDLLNLTARVLRENEEVRRALQQKFGYLLVDEFQDTDPVQAEILFWLAEDGARLPGSKSDVPDWRKVPLRPGALFIVGDPKQSIYRFRRADIDIYNLVRKRFSDPASWACRAAYPELPVSTSVVQLGKRGLSGSIPGRADCVRASLRTARCKQEQQPLGGRLHYDSQLRSQGASREGCRKDRDLHSIGSRCRPSPVQ